ncbi:natterin-3-like [Hippocampus comes]|uniref:Natterin-3-like n=1 Tax=Hippocampus comes TaxID=109280 RepID=A0A3Q2Z2S1_HIPCM|nr:PREDICTED: natterin-3-like [Hippocampus comes]XP_019740210.1 PREDICTED: natterin-3-like [Hippocampus comes]
MSTITPLCLRWSTFDPEDGIESQVRLKGRVHSVYKYLQMRAAASEQTLFGLGLGIGFCRSACPLWCLMNPSAIVLLLALPALTSAQGPDCAQPKIVMDPALIDVVPQLSGAGSPRLMLSNTSQAAGPSSDFDFEGTNLEWQQWTGSLPDGAVSIYNGYTKSLDYICKHECDSGYYRPSEGDFCVYSYSGEAVRTDDFSLLVNKDKFEILEWQQGAYGSVAWNAVKNCKDSDKYVGKNAYGLGKVHVSHRVFYLPWGKYEYNYPKDYMFLTINEDIQEDHLMSVTYHTEGINVVEHPPEMMKNDSVENRECLEATITDTLSKSNKVEHRWQHTFSLSLAASTTFTTSIPHLFEGAIKFSIETNFAVTMGTTYTETTEHKLKLTTKVPPNNLCRIHMVGKKYGADIPYTARLKRTYTSGETKWTTVTGTYSSVQISEVNGMVDRCELVPDAKPC